MGDTSPSTLLPQTILLHCCAIKLDFSNHLHGKNLDFFDLHLFDKIPSLVGTGLEVRLNVQGTVKW